MTEELYGAYNFMSTLPPVGEAMSDVPPVKALVGITSKRTCVKLTGSGLPAGTTAAVTLRRGRAGTGGEAVTVYEDAFSIPASGKLKTTQCVAITAEDDWESAFRRRPGRFALELDVQADPDVLYAGQVAKRR